MGPHERLTQGQSLQSPNAQYQLVLQGDGNIVEYTKGRPVWASGTTGQGGETLTMQRDGNLVLQADAGQVVWKTDTNGRDGAVLEVQDDGNVVIYAPGHTPVWATSTRNSTMHPGERLTAGQFLRSPNGQHQLAFQGDGNFVLYSGGKPTWASETGGSPAKYGELQSDGNLVLYSDSRQAVWSSGTQGREVSHLEVQDDGNVVLYDPRRQAFWSTGTAQGGTAAGTAQGNDDYPYRTSRTCADGCEADPWGFFKRECTSFVAFRLNQRGVAFSNTMRGGRWGNAEHWDDNAVALGYPVDGTPEVGDIAQWNPYEQDVGYAGHVAYVAAVHGDGTVDIEEYNYSAYRYTIRRNLRAPRYIHVTG